MKRIFCAFLLAAISITAMAQSGTNSPYSMYGLGALADQTSGFNRGMNGLGLGFREHNQVNFLNPASYSSIDSLSFIFDAGLSGQITNFQENGKKVNAKNADFEYVVAGFRAFKHFGISFGLIPYSNVGYQYQNTQQVSPGSTVTSTTSYSGRGGLHQVYIGFGWELVKGLSIGANASYLWGNYTRSVLNTYSDSYVNTLSRIYTANVHNYKLDVGLQYAARFSKSDQLTLGLAYSLGHKFNANPKCEIVSSNPQTQVSYSKAYTADDALELPTSYSVGLAWDHKRQWKVGVDYNLQKWADVVYPLYTNVNNVPQYSAATGQFKDRHKLTLGAELCPGETARNFFKRVHYRAGISYVTPYLIINGTEGPKEMSASLGLGIPVMNGINNRSILNISAQWVRMDSKTLLKENTFRINIGLTFNERWFAKWKVD